MSEHVPKTTFCVHGYELIPPRRTDVLSGTIYRNLSLHGSSLRLPTVSSTSDHMAMHANSTVCAVYWWHDIGACMQQFMFGIIFASKETTANAFRTACLPSASPAGPRIYPTMQRALGLFWSLTSSWFKAITWYDETTMTCNVGTQSY